LSKIWEAYAQRIALHDVLLTLGLDHYSWEVYLDGKVGGRNQVAVVISTGHHLPHAAF
jgi:hypothetical protein